MVAEQNMVMLLDTDRLLAADELSAFHHYSSDTP
jgi:hypothetical protein